MKALTDMLARATAGAAVVLLAALVVLASAEAVAWTFFQRSWAWAGEVEAVLLVWFGLLAAALVTHEGLHLRVELFVDRLPAVLQRLAARFAVLAVAVFGGLLSWYGAALARTVTNTLPATGWSAGTHYVPVAVGGTLIAVFAAAQLFSEPAPR